MTTPHGQDGCPLQGQEAGQAVGDPGRPRVASPQADAGRTARGTTKPRSTIRIVQNALSESRYSGPTAPASAQWVRTERSRLRQSDCLPECWCWCVAWGPQYSRQARIHRGSGTDLSNLALPSTAAPGQQGFSLQRIWLKDRAARAGTARGAPPGARLHSAILRTRVAHTGHSSVRRLRQPVRELDVERDTLLGCSTGPGTCYGTEIRSDFPSQRQQARPDSSRRRPLPLFSAAVPGLPPPA